MRLGIPALQHTHRELFGKDCAVLHVLYLRRKLAFLNFRHAPRAVCLRSRVSMRSALPGKPRFGPAHIPIKRTFRSIPAGQRDYLAWPRHPATTARNSSQAQLQRETGAGQSARRRF
jgi:hypothetical protein